MINLTLGEGNALQLATSSAEGKSETENANGWFYIAITAGERTRTVGNPQVRTPLLWRCPQSSWPGAWEGA